MLKDADLKASHKIEVSLTDDKRDDVHPFPALIMIWDSSGQIFGEGDSIMGFCPRCPDGILHRTDELTSFCLACKQPFPAKDTVDIRAVRLTITGLSGLLEKIFVHLGCDADVYIKHLRKDIRYQTQDYNQKVLLKARAAREPAIYTMKRILQDTGNGASISSRFRAFLTA